MAYVLQLKNSSKTQTMIKVTKKAALEYHRLPRPGKIEVVPTKPYTSQLDLSLAYSPGVAYPCEEIKQHPEDVYDYTDKGNLVGVVSNCTAVLGLGDIGPLAGKPVMEGKALLFKIFAGLDSFDIELDEKNPEKVVETVKALSPTFGGINLEDIKAPECFYIEKRLKEECNIPIMHDDQHGTAIISGAGLINALDIQGKKIEDVRLVVNGAGAAAISCTRLYLQLGIRKENVVMCDSKGVIRADNPHLNEQKREFATTRDIHTLAEALEGADVFLGLSVADVMTPEMLLSMAPKPIVFALANPNPEISYELAMKTRNDLIFATGRSDYPNQINNVIGFPYIFRGALDCRATCINEAMKIGAVHAIAALARKPVPRIVDNAYGETNLHFGPQYILPKALDPRLLTVVAPAVAKAAAESGVGRRPIIDFVKYEEKLEELVGRDNRLMRRLMSLAKRYSKRVVFAEGYAENVIRASARLVEEKICRPVLLGEEDVIRSRAAEWELNIDGVEIISTHSPAQTENRHRYAEELFRKLEREGMTLQKARQKMHSEEYFGMMMVETGDADAFIGSTYTSAHELSDTARKVIGMRPGYDTYATMHILNTRTGTYFLADTAINRTGTSDTLVQTARLANEAVLYFGIRPVMAMLSYSTFGSDINTEGLGTDVYGSPACVAKAVQQLHENYPKLEVDGEMQANYALDNELRDKMYPFNRLFGKKVNTLIFPDLNSANITYRMFLASGAAEVIGPIQLGLNKPVHFINTGSEVREIVNLTAVAVVDAATMNCTDDQCRLEGGLGR